MKTRQVTIAAGVGFTSILATIPAHELLITEDIVPKVTEFEVQWSEDSFAATHQYAAGSTIRKQGQGGMGILGAPPGYFASGVPATGAILVKIRDKSGTGTVVKVVESESIIYNDQV